MISTRLPFRIAAIARNTRQAPISSIFAARFLASRNIIRPTVAVRTYATPGRPKKGSVGATATRRKTVTKTTSKAKKPTAKKTPARKVKTEAQKQKELLQKEKAKAKKAATAERLQKQKKARAVKEKDTKARNHLRELKATALSPPSQTAGSAYIMFYKAKMANEPGRLHSVGLRTYAKEVSSEYKALSGSELESYKRRSQEESAKNEREYQSWVTSHTPEQIRQANLARAELKRLKVPGFTLYKEIKDNRQLTRPGNAFSIFVRDVKEDVGLTSVGELGREAARRWRSLEPSEKQKYQTAYTEAKEKYARDFQSVYGTAPSKSFA